MNIEISKLTLAQLYEYINKSLKGSGCSNEEVTITARVKVPIGTREGFVQLKIVGATAKVEEIPQHERDKMSGMYPPTRKAQVFIDCEIIENEPTTTEGKASSQT